jgi:hypothetical protein
VDVVDDMGRTPIDMVRGDGGSRGEARSTEIVTLLEPVGAAPN